MKKTDALALFDNNISAMARAVGVSRYTIHRWPKVLEKSQANMVTGARVRLDEERRKQLDKLLNDEGA